MGAFLSSSTRGHCCPGSRGSEVGLRKVWAKPLRNICPTDGPGGRGCLQQAFSCSVTPRLACSVPVGESLVSTAGRQGCPLECPGPAAARGAVTSTGQRAPGADVLFSSGPGAPALDKTPKSPGRTWVPLLGSQLVCDPAVEADLSAELLVQVSALALTGPGTSCPLVPLSLLLSLDARKKK